MVESGNQSHDVSQFFTFILRVLFSILRKKIWSHAIPLFTGFTVVYMENGIDRLLVHARTNIHVEMVANALNQSNKFLLIKLNTI